MSYNFSLIFSMLFVVAFILLGGDMFCLSVAYSSLDSASITISYLIAKSGRTDNEFLQTLESNYKVTFESINPSNPQPGDVVDYVIYRMYRPLIISTSEMRLEAARTTVVGYYG